MIAALDAHYEGSTATVACVVFDDWPAAAPISETIKQVDGVAPYEPGAFWRRELPALLAILEDLAERPDIVVIDGYVWLGPDKPGLGARLFAALGGEVSIIGVAKTAFKGAEAELVLRGDSRTPLHITAAGMAPDAAADAIRAMHGSYRLPTLLTRADRLSRSSG